MSGFEKFFADITPAGSYDENDPTHRALRYTQEIAWKAGEHEGYKAGYEAGLRRAADALEMSNGEILLMAGELSAGELRAVRAVMSAKHRAILAQIGKGE